MRTIDDIEVKNVFPAIYWKKGELYRAITPDDLYIGPASTWKDFAESKPLEWHLMDVSGRCFDILRWERIEPYGGIKYWFERLTRQVFAVPILENERRLSLDEFKRTLEAAAVARYRHDRYDYALRDIKAALPSAKSYAEVLQALPKLM